MRDNKNISNISITKALFIFSFALIFFFNYQKNNIIWLCYMFLSFIFIERDYWKNRRWRENIKWEKQLMSKKHKDNIVKLFAKVIFYVIIGLPVIIAFFISLGCAIGVIILYVLFYLYFSRTKPTVKKRAKKWTGCPR